MSGPDLMDALRRFATFIKSATGPRPGSNTLPILEVASDDNKIIVLGEEMDALYRAGFLEVRPDKRGRIVANSDEYGGIEEDHLWLISRAGRTALAREEEDRER